MKINPCRYLGIFSLLLFVWGSRCEPTPTSSPDTEFLSPPTNSTVLEGTPAVLKCKIRQTIHTCQWFYLEAGLDFYDTSNTPVLVKEFRPARDRDCSIKFSKARREQNGQWMCKGLHIQRREYIISKPAYLKVMTRAEDMPVTPLTDLPTRPPETEEEVKFTVAEDGHLINTGISQTVPLHCEINQAIEMCSWITPSGKRLSNPSASATYTISKKSNAGICSLEISEVRTQDEGNWRCVVTRSGEAGERLGPIIHLHLIEFGPHFTGSHVKQNSPSSSKSSIVMPLIAVSLFLLLLVVLLFVVIYKKAPHLLGRTRANANNEEAPETKTDSTGTAIHKLDPSYSASYLSSPAVLQPSMQQEAAVPNHYTRYLDMRGSPPQPGSYVTFPASPYRSPSTATTVTAVSSPMNSSCGGSSGQASFTGSQNVGPSFENVCFESDPNGYPVYNVYEEIDERYGRLGRRQSHPSEDPEGYMMPRTLGRAPIPPPLGHNYANEPPEQNQKPQAHNTSRVPTVPTRSDSVDNPLSTYDVPTPDRNPPNEEKEHIKSVLV